MRDAIPTYSWATARGTIRAALLTSTRAIPDAHIDALSDYDVILIVQELHPYVADRAWLNDFGDVLVVYWDPIHPDPVFGVERCANVTQYADGLKIDFTLWPVALFQQIVAAPAAARRAGRRLPRAARQRPPDRYHARADIHGLCAGTTFPRDLSDPDQRFLERCALRRQVPLARRAHACQVVPGLRHEADLSAADARMAHGDRS